jgi:hypothetical protein
MADGGMRDRVGAALERRLDDAARRAGEHALGPAVLGVAVAAGVVAGGIGAFVVVLVVLVRFFA